MKVSEAFSTAGASLKSLVKIALLSRRPTVSRAPEAASRPLVILANGPSLRKTIAERLDDLKDMQAMAVNFAALADEFTQIRPGRYILADPHFFAHGDDKNVAALALPRGGRLADDALCRCPAAPQGIRYGRFAAECQD